MKNKNYNVIHIKDYYPSKENPASSPWVFDQVISLKEYRYESLVISPTPYLPNYLRKKGRYYLYPRHCNTISNYQGTDVIRPRYIKIPNDRLFGVTFCFLEKSITKVSQYAKEAKLIHAHFGQNGIASVNIKQRMKIPLITSFYGYDSGRLRHRFKLFYKKLINNGDLFLALSNDMKKDLIEIGFPDHKIKIHHLGINLKQFSPSKNQNKSHFVFLVVARFDESKGVQDVIKAFKIIQNSSMLFRIVGDGPYKPQLIELVRKLKLQTKVRFINNFKADNPRQVVVEEMQNSDVVLLTSYITPNGTKEGTPVVLMEAQACGKPCITTNHAGIPEVVLNNKTGFIIDERDIDQISNRMKQLYEDFTLREQMGYNAISHIQKEFNQSIQMEKLVNIYNTLLKKNV